MCLQATVLGCTELWTGFSRGALQRIRLITSLLAETCSSSNPVCCCCASLQLRTFLLFHKHRSVTHEAYFSSTTSWNLWCGVIHIVNVESKLLLRAAIIFFKQLLSLSPFPHHALSSYPCAFSLFKSCTHPWLIHFLIEFSHCSYLPCSFAVSVTPFVGRTTLEFAQS